MLNARALGLDKAVVGTAGAYVIVDGYFPFWVSPKHNGDTLAVIRLGGHREEGETGWQCAAREVYEETRLNIRPLQPPATYWLDRDRADACLQQVIWPHDTPDEMPPLYVASNHPVPARQLSVMYLAKADELPTPSSEVRGLLLLKPDDVLKIVQKTITLGQYLRDGGKAMLHEELDENKELEPFGQLRVLPHIMEQNRDYFDPLW